MRVLPVTSSDVLKAVEICQTSELLSNASLVVAVMLQHGLTHLCSHDADFDRVSSLTRYAPE